MTTNYASNYANKRVEIKSEKHLKHVIEVTGMSCNPVDFKVLTLSLKYHSNICICFHAGFSDENNDDWYSDYRGGFSNQYEDSTLELEQTFIDFPSGNDKNMDELWA